MLGSLRMAFDPDYVLQLALKFGPFEARRTVREVFPEEHGSIRIELTVKVVLDLDQHFVATNLGQGHAP